jgi:hypothetical protein
MPAVSWRVIGMAACACLLAASGCRSPQTVEPSDLPPSWTLSLPSEPGYLCAVGSWPRTWNMQDAKDRAVEAARSELARSISVKVQTVIRDWQSSPDSAFGSSGIAREYTEIMSKSVTDTVLTGSEVQAIWVDRQGRIGAPDTAYALVRMQTSEAVRGAQKAGQKIAEERKADPSAREAVNRLNAELEKVK